MVELLYEVTIMKHFLVVVDIQNDFVNGALGTDEAVGIIDALLKK